MRRLPLQPICHVHRRALPPGRTPPSSLRTRTQPQLTLPANPGAIADDAASPPTGPSSSDDDDDDFVDPSLKRTFPRSQNLALPTPPARFAQNTGMFLPLPGAHEQGGDMMTAADYTHISQALAHQPLATNPSQQTIDLMTKLDSAGTTQGTLEERMDAFMKEVKTQVRSLSLLTLSYPLAIFHTSSLAARTSLTVSVQMFNVSQRVDIIETGRFATTNSLSAVQSSLASLESRLLPSTASSDPTSLLSSSSHHTPGLLVSSSLAGPSANPVSDAANAHSAMALGAIAQTHLQSQFEQLTNGTMTPEFKEFLEGSGGPPPAGIPLAKPRKGKKAASAKKDDDHAAPVSTKKARKPELSRAVRGTMFRLLGLSLATNAPKYHGYTSSPDLPEFSASVAFDPTTGSRLWRWEWEKTIRQSPYNAAFSMAIQNQVLADREMGMYKDVPEGDWPSLEEAVDSAYTNLRRERESQVDPNKKAKKDEHRKRGKKRGLKEEKQRRRTKALEDARLAAQEAGEDAEPNWTTQTVSHFILDAEDELEDALEMRYMSSEEEVDTSDPVRLSIPCVDIVSSSALPSTSLVPGEKTFSVHRPSWRSQRLLAAFSELDALRPPERAYRRIQGEGRRELPPTGTAGWMISDEWVNGEGAIMAAEGVTINPQREAPKRGRGKGKGK